MPLNTGPVYEKTVCALRAFCGPLRLYAADFVATSSLRAGWVVVALMCLLGPWVPSSAAQVTTADYQRAQALRQQYESAAVFVPDTPTWINGSHASLLLPPHAGQRLRIRDGRRRHPAEVRRHSITIAAGRQRCHAPSGRAYTSHPASLPNTFTFNDALSAIEMTDRRRALDVHARRIHLPHTRSLPPPGEIRRGISGPVRGDIAAVTPRPRVSPDGRWMAFIDNYNIAHATRSPGGETYAAQYGRL